MADPPDPDSTREPNQLWTWQNVEDALRDLQFGSVTLFVQDGIVVQVERTERKRYQRRRAGGVSPLLARNRGLTSPARLNSSPTRPRGRLGTLVCVVDRATGDMRHPQEGTHACLIRRRSPGAFPRRLFSFLVVLALVALCPACSNGRKPVYPVRARVLVDGKPAVQAQVLFHPSENTPEAPRPTGQTDDQGYFNLTTYANGDGAPEGDYAVTVTWFRVFPTGNQRNAELVRHNVLPRRYAVPDSSRLKATVSKGENELPPLQLTSR